MAADPVDGGEAQRAFREGKWVKFNRSVTARGHNPIQLWLAMKDDGSQAKEHTEKLIEAAEQIAAKHEPKVTSMGLPNFEGLVDAMDKLEFTLETEAGKFHGEIAALGPRGLAAIQKGRDRMSGVGERIARVEQFVAKLEGSNGAVGNSSEPSTASTGTESAKA